MKSELLFFFFFFFFFSFPPLWGGVDNHTILYTVLRYIISYHIISCHIYSTLLYSTLHIRAEYVYTETETENRHGIGWLVGVLAGDYCIEVE